MKLTRRDFLLSSSGLLLLSNRSAFSQDKKSVIVAGAGLSGLSAAYELALKGFDVTVIEGRDRIGGRIRTLREPFSDGLHVETGGEIIGDGYTRMLGYLDKFGIEYQELRGDVETGGALEELQQGIGMTAYMKGNLYPRGTVLKRNPYGLKGDEAIGLPPNIYSANLRTMYNEVRNNTKTLADYDKLSLAQALLEKGVSQKAIELIDISLNYNSINNVSAGGVLSDNIRRRASGSVPIKVDGGNDLIPKALAENAVKNGVKILLSSKIKRISQGEKSVKVFYHDRSGRLQSAVANKLVCTIPFSVLREVEFLPGLPQEKRRAIEELDYTLNTKVYLQTKYREWGKRALGASVWTDTRLERIFSSTGQPGDSSSIFTIWTEGNGSKFLEKMSTPLRMDYARRKFEEILPFMAGSVERTHTKSWSQDEFVRGAYSQLNVGQLTSIKPDIKTAVGNIHFAGEHTAETSPGMEGALESAERVVDEITAAGV